MSFFTPKGPTIPGSINNRATYSKLSKFENIITTDIVATNFAASSVNLSNMSAVDINASGTINVPRITGLVAPIASTDATNKQYVDSQIGNPGSIEYQVIVQKNPATGQYSTIEAALLSITDAAIDKPYCVYVGPGVYYENELIIPSYVSIKGDSILSTIISPIIANQYLIKLNKNSELSFLTLKGITGSVSPGPGAGYPSVYCEDIGDFSMMHKVSILDFDIGIENYSTNSAVQNSILYIEYVDVSGNYSYAIKNRSGSTNTGYLAYTSLENFFTYPSTSVTKTAVINDGINTKIEFMSCNFTGSTGMRGIQLQNGGDVIIVSTTFKHFDNTAIYSANIGLGTSLKIESCTFDNCTLDFDIQNIGTIGYFFGNSPKSNHFIADGASFYKASEDKNVVNVSKTGGDYDNITDAVSSITDSSLLNPYVIKVGPGIYVEDSITLSEGIFIIGPIAGGAIIVPTISTATIIIGTDGALIQNMSFGEASGIGGKAVYLEGNTGTGMMVRDCNFSNNYTNVHAHGASTATVIFIDRCITSGNANTAFLATNVGSVIVRCILSNVTYQDFSLPVCTYFARAEGTNVLFTSQNSILSIATPNTSICYYFDNGVEARISTTTVRGFDKILYVPSGGTASSTIYVEGILYSNITGKLADINNNATIGYWNSSYDYSKMNIPTDAPFYISGTDSTIINVQQKGGDFRSIVEALNNITDADASKRYIIKVGSGTFIEPEIVMKKYVSIQGSGRSTVVSPDANNHHIIKSCDYVELTSMILSGAGSGYAAIYHETPDGERNTSLICRGILFGINDTHVWAYGNIGTSNVIIFNSRYGGTAQFNYGFKATNNNNSVASKITIIGTVSQNFTSPFPRYVCCASGENCTVSVNGFNIINNLAVESGTVGFKVDNGGMIRMLSTTVKGFECGVLSENNGIGPNIVVSGCTFNDCTTDINIQHTETVGSISASASRNKIIINGVPPISLFIVDPENTGIAFSGPFYYSDTNFGDTIDVSSLISETPTFGVVSGGDLTISSGLTLAISAGMGYCDNNSDTITRQEWLSGTLLLSANSNSFVYVNSNGNITAGNNYPDTTKNILLGQVSTDNTNIIYIQNTRLNSRHWSNYAVDMLNNALGPVYSSGSSVAETGTRQLNVSQGTYYLSSNKFLPSGANPITFNMYYRSAVSGIYTSILNQTTVPNGHYDNGSGTLSTLTTGYYTKHLLCILGGPSEYYAMIYGQEEYISSSIAEAAGLPVSPSFITGAFTNIASIIVQEGNPNIVLFVDERPRIGFASSSVTGTITVHGDLLGLTSNDHPQYLLADGSGTGMSGNLDLNNNNIVDVVNINGFPISGHASRHAFNGPDSLSPALAVNISELSDSVASAGINNSLIPRADHVHPHGNRGGGTLHSVVISGGSAGFMSGADKSKLDGIQTGATNTTPSDNLPENITKSVASAGISLEVSRQDHKHDISTAAPSVVLLTTTTNSEGSATSLARSDHTHASSTGVPIGILPDETNAEGNATSFARSDHIHNIPTGIAVGLNANSTSTQGAASTFARLNHSHAIASGVPSNQTIAVIAATGTSTSFARSDHIHTFSSGVPVSVGSENTEGTSTSFARADHIHNITLSGPISSSGTVTSVTSQSGTGSTFVMNISPTLITPIIGAATGTSLETTGTLKSKTSLIVEDPGAGTNIITLQAPSALVSSYTLTLPSDDGTSGQILSTNGTGVLSWSNAGLNGILTSGNIYVGNISNVATSTIMSGDATINNTGVLSLSATVRQLNDIFITSGTTYTTPSNITPSTKFKITLIGAGGGGGGSAANNNSHAGGGGAGGVGVLYTTELTANTVYAVSIGTGGTAGAAGSGTGGTGGNTTITIGVTTYTASGGTGGTITTGGSGGTITNIPTGGIIINGQSGIATPPGNNATSVSGSGGDSGLGFGSGGSGRIGTASPGFPGTGYGGGGGGASGNNQIGGIGSNGAILIEYSV